MNLEFTSGAGTMKHSPLSLSKPENILKPWPLLQMLPRFWHSKLPSGVIWAAFRESWSKSCKSIMKQTAIKWHWEEAAPRSKSFVCKGFTMYTHEKTNCPTVRYTVEMGQFALFFSSDQKMESLQWTNPSPECPSLHLSEPLSMISTFSQAHRFTLVLSVTAHTIAGNKPKSEP